MARKKVQASRSRATARSAGASKPRARKTPSTRSGAARRTPGRLTGVRKPPEAAADASPGAALVDTLDATIKSLADRFATLRAAAFQQGGAAGQQRFDQVFDGLRGSYNALLKQDLARNDQRYRDLAAATTRAGDDLTKAIKSMADVVAIIDLGARVTSLIGNIMSLVTVRQPLRLVSMSNPVVPVPKSVFEGLEAAPVRRVTRGGQGTPATESSRALQHLVVKGRRATPLRRPGGGALESIIDIDDRVRILETDLPPWRMICALRLRGPFGSGAIGTGWMIGPKTVLTAGHCVYSTQFFGGWATEIEISAGRNGDVFPFDTVKSRRFSSVNLWVEQEDPDFDIGCIHLDDPLGERVGWFSVAALGATELEDFLVNVAGYPGDRGGGTELYHHRNRVLSVTERRIFYDVDTFGGQSGAPVWIHEQDDAPPLAIGIHAYGVGANPPGMSLRANSAPRIIPEVLDQIEAWVNEDGGWPTT